MSGLTAELRAKGVQYVRFLWCDNANVLRARVVPIDSLKSVYQRGVGLSFAQQAVPVTRDAFVAESGLGPVGEVRLVGDWTSLVHLPYAPGHARVIGNMYHQEEPWPHCPRAFLTSMVQKAHAAGIQIRAAFENEFYLLQPSETGFKPLDSSLFCSVYSLNQNLEVLTDMVESLEDQDLQVVQFHPESGGGQMEISINHNDPMSAADQQITFRETIHAVAQRHGLAATFLPKPFPDSAGSGCHIHLSIWRDGRNITDPRNEEDPTAAHFMAGILKDLPALMALTTPSRNSYQRLGPHLWSGAFSCWGYDNREAALRLPTSPHGVTHFELKTADATANPYLALGGVIAAGLHGLRKKIKFPDGLDVDPGLLSEKERKSQGVKALPRNFKKSLDAFAKSKCFKEAMGEELHRSYLSVKREEFRSAEEMGPEEELALLMQRY